MRHYDLAHQPFAPRAVLIFDWDAATGTEEDSVERSSSSSSDPVLAGGARSAVRFTGQFRWPQRGWQRPSLEP
jgi:hypothetical protein